MNDECNALQYTTYIEMCLFVCEPLHLLGCPAQIVVDDIV